MKNIWKIFIVFAIIALPLVFWGNIKKVLSPLKPDTTQQEARSTDEDGHRKIKKEKKGKSVKKGKKEQNENDFSESKTSSESKTFTDLKVIDQWELPSELVEISGLEYLGNNKFACIQDEEGTIFIYDTGQKRITKKVPFSGAGDYEGIAIVGATAYVVRSDGRIYEVNGFDQGKPSVNEYTTPLNGRNVEGLCYDQKNNRLLLAIKGDEPGNKDYKGIYAFDLKSKKLASAPVYKIEFSDAVFADLNEKKAKNTIQPSDLDINPSTSEIYVIEGASPKVLIMEEDGRAKKLYQMSTSDFKQAEGITFSPQGELYISNEGRSGAANILKVEIKR